MRTSAFRVGELFRARSPHQSRETIVSFDAARLVIKPVVLITLPGELLADGPRLSPHRRIFHGDDIFERGWPGARPALDKVQVFARPLKICLRAEVGRQVRTAAHDDVALPSLALTYIVEDRDAARRLHDPAKAAGRAAELRQPAGQAPVRQ